MDYATGNMCARCRVRVDQMRDCLGESGIYSPTGRAFTLCEPCFEEEDRETLGDRGNDLPERLEMYRANLRAGPLRFRAPVPPLSDQETTMTELSTLLYQLDQLCKKHGPDTPLGSRYSALHQQAQSYAKSDNPQQKEALAAFMARTQAEIAQIQKDGGEYIPENHIPGNRTAGEG